MSGRAIGPITVALLLAGIASAQEQSIIVQSSTSTANSGLYDHLLPIFRDKTGIQVHVVAVGTGQAIRNARNCDGDVLVVHAKALEEEFVAAGFGIARTDMMYNDFIIVGPATDLAGLGEIGDVRAALAQIAAKAALFVSRADNSGTHNREMALWVRSGIDPVPASGTWYREVGAGMGATLNTAIGMGAYVMTDRATWISFGNKQDYGIMLEGDKEMFNQYGVITVNPMKCPAVNVDAAQTFADWLVSDEGQAAIADFTVAGQQVFFPNAPDN